MSRFNTAGVAIGWADYSWNPVTGCKKGCPYCYARDIGNRLFGGFDPAFHPERLDAPTVTSLPGEISKRRVFVCSMGEILGPWVPQIWVSRIIKACNKEPRWTYMFLSKYPQGYRGWRWPKGAYLGATVDSQYMADGAEIAMDNLSAHVRFVSCEPLQEPVTFAHPDIFDWFIIGGRSFAKGMSAMTPDPARVESIIHQARSVGAAVWVKGNAGYCETIKETP